MTEEEAKTKWCPFAQSRVVSWREKADHITNAVCVDGDRGLTTQCLGSACMAWRATPRSVKSDDNGRTNTITEAGGYCGIAGVP